MVNTENVYSNVSKENPLMGFSYFGFVKVETLYWLELLEEGVVVWSKTKIPNKGWGKERASIVYTCAILEIEDDGLVNIIRLPENPSKEEVYVFLDKIKNLSLLGEQQKYIDVYLNKNLNFNLNFTKNNLNINVEGDKLEKKILLDFLNKRNILKYFWDNVNLKVNILLNGTICGEINGLAGLESLAIENGINLLEKEIEVKKSVDIEKEKVNSLSIRKGDIVEFRIEDQTKIGKIVKYPSNKEIHIDIDGEVLLTDKIQIISVIQE